MISAPISWTPNLLRRPAAGNLPKDRSLPSDRIDTGTAEPRHANPTHNRGTRAKASAGHRRSPACASGWYIHKRRPGRLFPASRLTHHRKRACRSSKPREAQRTRDPAPKRCPSKNGFVHISQCSFEFRLGAGIIGSSKNRSKPIQIINFDLGARIAGTIGRFVVSLDVP